MGSVSLISFNAATDCSSRSMDDVERHKRHLIQTSGLIAEWWPSMNVLSYHFYRHSHV
jgi:hypothetical protein